MMMYLMSRRLTQTFLMMSLVDEGFLRGVEHDHALRCAKQVHSHVSRTHMVEIVELDLARTRAYPAVLLTGSSAACAAAGAPPVRSAFSASAKKLPAVTIKIRFIPPTVFS